MSVDAVYQLGSALLTRPLITARIGQRVSTQLSSTYPQIRLTSVGTGQDDTPHKRQMMISVECWGQGAQAENDARKLSLDVWDALEDYVSNGMFNATDICACEVNVAPYSVGENETQRWRFIITVLVDWWV